MSNVAEELNPDTARRQLVEHSVQAAYADDVVVTKKNAAGETSSSISAPWLQAYMLETA